VGGIKGWLIREQLNEYRVKAKPERVRKHVVRPLGIVGREGRREERRGCDREPEEEVRRRVGQHGGRAQRGQFVGAERADDRRVDDLNYISYVSDLNYVKTENT